MMKIMPSNTQIGNGMVWYDFNYYIRKRKQLLKPPIYLHLVWVFILVSRQIVDARSDHRNICSYVGRKLVWPTSGSAGQLDWHRQSIRPVFTGLSRESNELLPESDPSGHEHLGLF
jgi:hypothetical protein